MNTMLRPRRSCLYIPGANSRALEKAKSLPADMLILDLEDAVAPESKLEAREKVSKVIQKRAYGRREVIVRINALNTMWGKDDLNMVASVAPDGVLVPKVGSGDEIRDIDRHLSAAGASRELGLWVMIELPLAILNIQEIAAASIGTRLIGLVLGTNDLAKELGAVLTFNRSAFQMSLCMALAAARAYGLVAIDGVYNDIADEAGFDAESQQGRILGFDGKTLIHPSQLDIANQIFAPTPNDLARAHAVIEAFELEENYGKGVLKVNGKMTELLHLEQAKQLVLINAAIESN